MKLYNFIVFLTSHQYILPDSLTTSGRALTEQHENMTLRHAS